MFSKRSGKRTFIFWNVCPDDLKSIFTARKRSLGQGNVFTPVYDSVHRGVSATLPAGINTPSRQTPRGRHSPPPGRHLPPGIPPRFGYYGIWSTSGRYGSYSNAYLSQMIILVIYSRNNGMNDGLILTSQTCSLLSDMMSKSY